MKLGYFTLTDNPPAYGASRKDPSRLLKEVLAQCIHAEKIGLNSVWVPEHHFGLFGVLPSAPVFLAYVAARTERVKLGPATVLLPVQHPLRVAEEFALLDLLSNGRAQLSVGRGYDAREYTAFGADFAQSQEIFFEGLDVIKKAWSQETVSHHGVHYDFPEITVLPRPVQQPHPPIYVACFSEPTLRHAARAGFDFIFAPFAAAMMFGSLQNAVQEFKKESEAAGHEGRKAMCSYFVNVTYDGRQTLETKERLLHYFKGILPAFPADRAAAPAHIRYFVDIVERMQAMTTEDLGERSIITGNPEDCLKVLRDCESAGIEEVILYFGFGGWGHTETMKSMDRVAQELSPHFG
ncbi:MAG: LLM class flavin-dependent oxidoreductase [Chloroflexi bacterium]|nr:LLM class flavin-dependent oxidoreductase [Chloroflexota bacterium]